MIERLPQGVRQDADENVGLGAAGVVVPDRPQEQVRFQNAKGAFDDRELNVRFPKFLGGPAGLVAAQQGGAVATQGVLEFGDVPRIGKFSVRSADVDRDEGMRLGETLFETADGFENLVAFLEPAFTDTQVKLLKSLC